MLPHRKKIVVLCLALALTAGCASTGNPDDPLEPVNRATHAINKGLDTVVLRPASQVYGAVAPQPLRQGVNNFAENLSVPGSMVNDLLQGNVEDAFHNLARFTMNTTFGLGGIFDTATALGIEERPSDFGETLKVWGVAEGAYVELPVLGPATTRSAVGQIVDIVINPARQVLPVDQRWVATAADVAQRVDTRYSFASTIDAVLYESADSYEQSRLLFLQNRRFALGESEEEEDELYDLYEEAFE